MRNGQEMVCSLFQVSKFHKNSSRLTSLCKSFTNVTHSVKKLINKISDHVLSQGLQVFLSAIHFGMLHNTLMPSSAEAGKLTAFYSRAPGSMQEEEYNALNSNDDAISLLLFTIYLSLHIIQLSVFLLQLLAFLLEFCHGSSKKLVKL